MQLSPYSRQLGEIETNDFILYLLLSPCGKYSLSFLRFPGKKKERENNRRPPPDAKKWPLFYKLGVTWKGVGSPKQKKKKRGNDPP